MCIRLDELPTLVAELLPEVGCLRHPHKMKVPCKTMGPPLRPGNCKESEPQFHKDGLVLGFACR